MTRREAARLYRESWRIYRSHPVAILLPGVVLFGLFAVPSAFLSEINERTTVAHDLVVLAVELCSFLSTFLYYAYCERIVHQVQAAAKVSVWRGLRGAARVLVPVAAASVVSEVVIFIGLLLLVVPGLYLVVRFVLVAPATSFEKLWPWRALARSWSLTRGRFWLAAATGGVLFALEILAGSGGEAVGAHITSDETVGRVIGETVADLVVGPFGGVLTAALYFRLKEAMQAQRPVAAS